MPRRAAGPYGALFAVAAHQLQTDAERGADVAARGFFRGIGVMVLDAAHDRRVFLQRFGRALRPGKRGTAQLCQFVLQGLQRTYEIAVVGGAVDAAVQFAVGGEQALLVVFCRCQIGRAHV